MSHGDVTVTVGDCPVCGQTGVELHRYIDYLGNERLACTDEFACAAAWAASSKWYPKRQRRRP